MDCLDIKEFLQGMAAVAAFVSAALWVVSARVKAKVEHVPLHADGMAPHVVNDEGASAWHTLKKQALWNSRAASAAAVAAVLQGVSLLPFL